MMAQGRTRMTGMMAAALLLLAAPVLGSVEVSSANGITAIVHSAADVAAALTERGGAPVLEHPVLGAVTLVDDARTWYPFDTDVVADALRTMQGFTTDVTVHVFILPAPPADVLSSYAVPGAIVLSPGTGPVAAETVSYITVHEMGHVLTSAFVDGQAGRWDAYLALRGLDESTYGPTAMHADRPREILAEDIRFLFGGALATASGSIENHDLALPTAVYGLEDLLAGFLAGRAPVAGMADSRAWPNPCNPMTTISMDLPAGATASGAELRIYDVRGALVRTLTGGVESGGRIALQWQGDTDRGSAAASGRYLYVMTAAGAAARGAVTLVR